MATELQELQKQINIKTDESLDSTRRMLALVEESSDAGAKTLTMLDIQGEKLDRIEEGMTQINQDMKEAEKNLEGMEKCCGLCVLPWKRGKTAKKEESAWKTNEDCKVNTDGPRMVVGDASHNIQGGFVTRITNDAREDEMEQNLVDVSSMLGNLKNMAIDMHNEIDSQNRQLDRINTQAIVLDERVQSANSRATKILN
ncbi:hypothetical protein HELRODRAFT_155336, partial [Helobdella robusta]|uniref:Synaptosomal-associated protein n=1 Tax=Helobdella robusta TaxID=6412 RepID=T1ELH9_HELRO